MSGSDLDPLAVWRPVSSLRAHARAAEVPPLAPEVYAALKADVRARGLQVPLEVTAEGTVLDGHARLRVAQWTLSLDSQGLSGSVSLGTLIDDPLLKLARKVLGIGDGSTVVGGTGPATRSEQLVPAAPTGLTVVSVTSPLFA